MYVGRIRRGKSHRQYSRWHASGPVQTSAADASMRYSIIHRQIDSGRQQGGLLIEAWIISILVVAAYIAAGVQIWRIYIHSEIVKQDHARSMVPAPPDEQMQER